jgi:hypothetical protein
MHRTLLPLPRLQPLRHQMRAAEFPDKSRPGFAALVGVFTAVAASSESCLATRRTRDDRRC